MYKDNENIKKIVFKIISILFVSTILTNILMYIFDFLVYGGFEKFFTGDFNFLSTNSNNEDVFSVTSIFNILISIFKVFFYFKINVFFFLINFSIIFMFIFIYYMNKLFDTRNENSVVNKNQFGNNRFAIKSQYKEIPDKNIEYEGKGGILISRNKNKV